MVTTSQAKIDKAVGTDDIPAEALQNVTAKHFLYSYYYLYNSYEHSIIPTTWLRGIINLVPMDNNLDLRDPLDRGFTLDGRMYNLYFNILNSHLTKWAEVNGLIVKMALDLDEVVVTRLVPYQTE